MATVTPRSRTRLTMKNTAAKPAIPPMALPITKPYGNLSILAGFFAPPSPPPAALSVPDMPVHVENVSRHLSFVHVAHSSEKEYPAHTDRHPSAWQANQSIIHCRQMAVYN